MQNEPLNSRNQIAVLARVTQASENVSAWEYTRVCASDQQKLLMEIACSGGVCCTRERKFGMQ